MSVTFTRTYSDAWGARAMPPINKRAKELERIPRVQLYLENKGIEEDPITGYRLVDDLTAVQRAQLVIDFYVYGIIRVYEIALAEEVARETAAGDLTEDDMEIGDV